MTEYREGIQEARNYINQKKTKTECQEDPQEANNSIVYRKCQEGIQEFNSCFIKTECQEDTQEDNCRVKDECRKDKQEVNNCIINKNCQEDRQKANNSIKRKKIMIESREDKQEASNCIKRRKCTNLVAKEKIKILEKLDKGSTTTIVAREYGINPTTIRKWRKNRVELEEKCKEGENKKRFKVSVYAALNEALYTWFRLMKERDLPLSGPILKEKALELNAKMNTTPNFNASEGWLSRWKQEYGIRQLCVTDGKLSSDFKETFSREIRRENLALAQIFNADETSLYYKMLPNKPRADEAEKQALELERNNECISVMLCCNAEGSLKLSPVVIEKSKHSRSLSKTLFPVYYRHQKSGCMSREIFEIWFKEEFVPRVKNFLRKRNLPEKAVLLLDNAPSHPKEGEFKVDDIRCRFLPAKPKIAALIQPMEQGITVAVRSRYRMNLLQTLLAVQNTGLDFVTSLKSITMEAVIHSIDDAWTEIAEGLISKCWKPLLSIEEDNGLNNTSDHTLPEQILKRLNRLNGYEDATLSDVHNWILAENTTSSEEPSINEVIDMVTSGTDDAPQKEESVSPLQAVQAARTLIKFGKDTGCLTANEINTLENICKKALRKKIDVHII